MTTLELIEKYGIGHNCLSDAYALGLADGLDGMENAVELAEEKAMVDAIEEFSHELKETFNNEFPINYHCTQPYFSLENARLLVDMVAEELKEKNE